MAIKSNVPKGSRGVTDFWQNLSEREEIRAALGKLRRELIGQQRRLAEFCDLVERVMQAPCPECARRREQTRLRVERVRQRAASKEKKGSGHAFSPNSGTT
jgi:hypothetical protein